MKQARATHITQVLDWCTSVLGPVEVISDHTKAHGGHEATICRLLAPAGFCYLKVHSSRSGWHNEVHAYERWACALGGSAPRLLAVREQAPPALVISELPGRIVENTPLTPSQERAVWRAAGATLIALHSLGPGEGFGPCLRDGTCAEALPRDAREYVSGRFQRRIDQATRGGYINEVELATLRAAYDLIPAFEDERPLPCHRDYCAANWLINEEGSWTGVIDFESACWDVRVADLSRDPDWAWVRRPDLAEAFSEGYGRVLTPAEERQLLVARAEYALDAIVWGQDNAFYGFEQEGRDALAHLAGLL